MRRDYSSQQLESTFPNDFLSNFPGPSSCFPSAFSLTNYEKAICALSETSHDHLSCSLLIFFDISRAHFLPSISISCSLLILCVPLLKTVSALLLLHQKAVAKWRLTSAAATEEGLCVFSSWGQIPLKRAKLRSTIVTATKKRKGSPVQ